MSILYDEATRIFHLQTEHSSYQMQVGPYGSLLHLYYGPRVEDGLGHLYTPKERGFSGNPADTGNDRTFSFDTAPQEYSCFGGADYRTACLEAVSAQGAGDLDLRYASHRTGKGKPALPGLPHVYFGEDEGETLVVILRDEARQVEVELFYSVLPGYDAITRHAVIHNRGREALFLERALSCQLDMAGMGYDLITFWGKHCLERQPARTPVRHGKITAESVRGTSSHQQNPFVILCEQGTGEEQGECWGLSFAYSGNFLAGAEVDQLGNTRVFMGIHPQGFRWQVKGGGAFVTPEVILCHSSQGLGGLSRQYHRLLRERLCRGEYKLARRPILINNWEATYFDFTGEKLLKIAEEAASLGVEMLVMDDGWFGARKDDYRGLGDWVVNEAKLGMTLDQLVKGINALGLKFGIWFEPEMVNEDSDLYRAHPDWCFRTPGRAPGRSRNQLVLDMGRAEVRDYVFDAMSAVLNSAHVEYVKWDMNRHLANVWSAALPPERQGEAYHRYVLGVYELMERFVTAFPHILLEGCSGGGGRFDAGILYYSPQIWCSDNTDAVDRISIQYGTSFGYPISAVGSHVSAVPNHQTGRVTPLSLRGDVAFCGTFGYELDVSKLSEGEKAEIRGQTAFYKKHYFTINQGDYYRLTDPGISQPYAAWQVVNRETGSALLFYARLSAQGNEAGVRLKLQGLVPEKRYHIHGTGLTLTGNTLMAAGLEMPFFQGDNQSIVWEIEEV